MGALGTFAIGSRAIGAGAPAATVPSRPARFRLYVSFDDDPFAPDWTELTDRLQEVHTRRGRAEAPPSREFGRMEAGSAMFRLDDTGRPGGRNPRELDPHNPASPYAGQLEEFRPVKLTLEDGIGETVEFFGYSDAFEPVTDGYNGHACVLTATDAAKFLTRYALPPSAWALWMENPVVPPAFGGLSRAGGPGVYSWWRLGEAAGAVPYDSGPAHVLEPTYQSHSSVLLGQPSLVSGDPNPSAYYNGAAFSLLDADGFPAELPFSIAMVIKCAPRAGTSNRRLLSMRQNTGSFLLGLSLAVRDSGAAIAPGGLNFTLAGAGGSEAIVGFTRVDDNQPHLVIITAYNPFGGTTRMGISVDHEVQVVSTMFSTITTVYSGDLIVLGMQHGGGGGINYDGWIDEVLALSYVWDTPAIQDSILDGVVWAGDYTDDRARRWLDLVDWPTALRDVPARADAGWGDVVMPYVQNVGSPPLAQLQATAKAEGGELYITKAGLVKMRGANALSSTVFATFGDAGGELPYESIELTRSKVYNRIRLARPNGSTTREAIDATSVAKYLPAPLDDTHEVVGDAILDARAAAILARTKAPATRLPSMVLAPHSDALVRAQVRDRELEDQVRVRHRPEGAGYTIDTLARWAGIAHDWTKGSGWRTTVFLEPY